MNSIAKSANRQPNQIRTEAAEAQSDRGSSFLENKSPHTTRLGTGVECSDGEKFDEIDQTRRDQAVLNLVAHWGISAGDFTSALADDLRILFGRQQSSAETQARLGRRIASGAILCPTHN